mmetsp:Transcript_18752/g.71341  ORF Transcript_18752/g.71341 Transcript_18752/m.71341 type:complete len:243 (+) Transcript_18752:2298-3026(+)
MDVEGRHLERRGERPPLRLDAGPHSASLRAGRPHRQGGRGVVPGRHCNVHCRERVPPHRRRRQAHPLGRLVSQDAEQQPHLVRRPRGQLPRDPQPPRLGNRSRAGPARRGRRRPPCAPGRVGRADQLHEQVPLQPAQPQDRDSARRQLQRRRAHCAPLLRVDGRRAAAARPGRVLGRRGARLPGGHGPLVGADGSAAQRLVGGHHRRGSICPCFRRHHPLLPRRLRRRRRPVEPPDVAARAH